jgi:c-di-GMP-binding flagellar brake protein YcgR
MSPSADDLLRDAIARNTPVILLAPADGVGESRRTRLLDESADGIWVEVPARQGALIEMLRASGRSVGIVFRAGERMVQFASPVLRYDARHRVSPTLTAEAALLAWPKDVALTQRRSGYRVKLPMDSTLKALAWVIPGGVDAPALDPSRALTAEVRDLSVGGLGLILRATRTVRPRASLADGMVVQLSADDKSITLRGPVRHEPRTLPDGSVRLGIDLAGTDRTLEGRRALQQVAQWVAEYQRHEARRRKAG